MALTLCRIAIVSSIMGSSVLVMSGPSWAAAIDLQISKTVSALPNVDESKKSQVTLSLDGSADIDRSANIEITEAQSGDKLELLPGTYEFQPGYYRVRVYQSLGAQAGHFDENYQMTEELIKISGFPAREVTLNYAKPKYRDPYYTSKIWTIGYNLGVTFGGYSAPNPIREHLEKLHVANAEPDKLAYADSGLDGNVSNGLSSYWATLLSNHMAYDYGLEYSVGSTLKQMSVSLGGGAHANWASWIVWGTLGVSVGYDQWKVGSYKSAFGTTELDSGAASYNSFVFLGTTPRRGGMSFSLKYAFVNPYLAVGMGWNFGAEKLNFRLPQLIRLNDSGA